MILPIKAPSESLQELETEHEPSRTTFLIVNPVECPNNPTCFDEELMVRPLIACPRPSKVPRNELEYVPIGSKVFPARDKSESRKTVVLSNHFHY